VAQEPQIVLTCDAARVLDGMRVTEGVQTVRIPRTDIDIELSPDARARFQPLLDVIAKQGRAAAGGKAPKARRVSAVRSPDAQPAGSAVTPEDPGVAVKFEVRPDGQCPVPTCDTDGITNGHVLGQHIRNSHLDLVPECTQPNCSVRTVSMYTHWRRVHPDVKPPAGMWKAERRGK
jgi:hypothetical protein